VMVAISSSRRKVSQSFVAPKAPIEALATLGADASVRASEPLAASRRDANSVDVHRNSHNEITQVRIGRWRTLASSAERRLVDVRELACQRVAVKIERVLDSADRPSSEIWQLYDLEGRLEAAMQTTPDGRFAMLTNYRTRQACRLAANGRGVLETVE